MGAGGKETHREAEVLFLQLPPLVQSGAAGVGADARVNHIQIDAGFLHGNQFVIMPCRGQVRGGEVRAVETERLAGADRQQCVTRDRGHLHPAGVGVRHVFLRANVMLEVVGDRGMEHALPRCVPLVAVTLHGAAAVVGKILRLGGHEEFHAETGQERNVLGHIGGDVQTNAALGVHRVGSGHLENGLAVSRGHGQGSGHGDLFLIRRSHGAKGATGGGVTVAGILPRMANVAVVVCGRAPNRGADGGGQHLVAVVRNGGNKTRSAVDDVGRLGGAYRNGGQGLLKRESGVGAHGLNHGHGGLPLGGNGQLDKTNLKADIAPCGGGVLNGTERHIAVPVAIPRGGGQGQFSRFLRLHGQQGATAGHRLAVAFHHPDEIHVREIGEIPEIFDDHKTARGIETLHTEGLDDLLVFHQSRVGATVGIDETVHAEVAVVGGVAEVAAVGVMRVGKGIVADGKGVIDELPDATAHEAVLGVNEVPVFLQAPGAVAHGVGVLAEVQRLGEQVAVEIRAPNFIGRGVHTALHIDVIALEGVPDLLVGLALQILPDAVGVAAGGVLGVNQALGVTAVEILAHEAMILAHARLVAHRPHQDARMVLVPLEHPLGAVKIGIGPLVTVGKNVPVTHRGGTVGLDVGLVDEVEAEFVAEPRETGVIRIVAGTDGIDVVLFHDHEVVNHMFHGGRRPEVRVAVMAVDALEFDLLPVEVQNAVLDLYVAEAEAQGDGLTAASENEGIEQRGLVRPEFGVIDEEVKRSLFMNDDAARFDLHPVRAEQAVFHQRLAVHRHLGGASAAGVGRVEFGTNIYIGDVHGVAQKQVDLAENARPAELVLVLQIRPVAPLEHKNLYGILARMEVLCDLELACHVADLAVAHKRPVDVEVEAGIHALEVEVEGFFHHGGVNLQGAGVESAGILLGNKGRVKGDGIEDIDVVRGVVSSPLHGLPRAGDVQLLGGRSLEKILGQVMDRGIKCKVPVAAKGAEKVALVTIAAERHRLVVEGDKVGAGLLTPHVEHGGILVKVAVSNEFVHGAGSFQRIKIYYLYDTIFESKSQ